jgi:hypothetical protein
MTIRIELRLKPFVIANQRKNMKVLILNRVCHLWLWRASKNHLYSEELKMRIQNRMNNHPQKKDIEDALCNEDE